MTKFDNMKEDMTKNSQKFENYQSEVESKRAVIQTLEAEIQTIMILNTKEQKLKAEILSEQKKLEQQVKTFSDLRNAL